MEYLLFGGSGSVGKSTAVYDTAQHFVSKGFVVIAGSIPLTIIDFMAVMEGNDKSGKNVRVIFNSATDTVRIIKNFKKFYDLHGQYDILISSVRDHNFRPRAQFFNILGINTMSSNIVEVPLGKTRGKSGRATAIIWFRKTLNNLVTHTLSNLPFSI